MEAVVIDCFALEPHHRIIRSTTCRPSGYLHSCCICAFQSRKGQLLPHALTTAWSTVPLGGFA